MVEETETKSEKKLENRAIAHKVSNLIHQQAGFISQTIDDYAQRQNERQVLHHNSLLFICKLIKKISFLMFANRAKGMSELI